MWNEKENKTPVVVVVEGQDFEKGKGEGEGQNLAQGKGEGEGQSSVFNQITPEKI